MVIFDENTLHLQHHSRVDLELEAADHFLQRHFSGLEESLRRVGRVKHKAGHQQMRANEQLELLAAGDFSLDPVQQAAHLVGFREREGLERCQAARPDVAEEKNNFAGNLLLRQFEVLQQLAEVHHQRTLRKIHEYLNFKTET